MEENNKKILFRTFLILSYVPLLTLLVFGLYHGINGYSYTFMSAEIYEPPGIGAFWSAVFWKIVNPMYNTPIIAGLLFRIGSLIARFAKKDQTIFRKIIIAVLSIIFAVILIPTVLFMTGIWSL